MTAAIAVALALVAGALSISPSATAAPQRDPRDDTSPDLTADAPGSIPHDVVGDPAPFHCDLLHDPGCGPLSMPAWTNTLGWTDLHGANSGSRVQFADLDGNGWPEVLGVDQHWTEIYTYRPMSSQCSSDHSQCGVLTPFDLQLFAGLSVERGWITPRVTDGLGSIQVGDFDADGRDELVARHPNAPGTFHLLDWNPDSQQMTLTATDTAAIQQGSQVLAGDVTGDERVEYIVVNPGAESWVVEFDANHKATATPYNDLNSIQGVPAGPLTVATVDRGGKQVLIGAGKNYLDKYWLTPQGWHTTSFEPGLGVPSNWRENRAQVFAVDTNGDGLDEIIRYYSPNDMVWIRPTPNPVARDVRPATGNVAIGHFIDVDGDGGMEMVSNNTSGQLTVVDFPDDIAMYDPYPSHVNNLYTTANGFGADAWAHSATWTGPDGKPMIISRHETGMRAFELAADAAVTNPAAKPPPFTDGEQAAYQAVSHATMGQNDIRAYYTDPNVKTWATDIANVQPTAGVDPAVFNHVKAIISQELSYVSTIHTYENSMKDALTVASLANNARTNAVISKIQVANTQDVQAHNSAVSMIESVIQGVVAIGGGAVAFALEQALVDTGAELAQQVSTAFKIEQRANTIKGMTSGAAGALDFLKASTPDLTYQSTLAELDQKLADQLTVAVDVHDFRISQSALTYGLLQVVGELTHNGTWSLGSTDAPMYRAQISRAADLNAYAAILPAVTDVWWCAVGGLRALRFPCGKDGSYNSGIWWRGYSTDLGHFDVKAFMAWRADGSTNDVTTNYGQAVPEAVITKLTGATFTGNDPSQPRRISCEVEWTTDCNFGFALDHLYSGQTPIPLNCARVAAPVLQRTDCETNLWPASQW